MNIYKTASCTMTHFEVFSPGEMSFSSVILDYRSLPFQERFWGESARHSCSIITGNNVPLPNVHLSPHGKVTWFSTPKDFTLLNTCRRMGKAGHEDLVYLRLTHVAYYQGDGVRIYHIGPVAIKEWVEVTSPGDSGICSFWRCFRWSKPKSHNELSQAVKRILRIWQCMKERLSGTSYMSLVYTKPQLLAI